MKRKVYLEGEIGSKFGKEFTMNVDSFGAAIRCLDANFNDFKKYLIECDERGVGFTCQIAGAPIQDEKELLLEYAEGDMVITAIPAGSRKSAIGRIIVGAILIYIAFSTGNFGLGTEVGMMLGGQGFTWAGAAGLFLGSMGMNLVMSGINELMAPDPSVDNDQDESYLFQGSGQMLVEGDPVPILYGQLRVPGRPVSLQVRNERQNFYDTGLVDAPHGTTTHPNQPPTNPPGGPVPSGPNEERENIQHR